MQSKRDKKNIMIGALLVVIMVMAVGYAALTTNLTINGTASIGSTWDVQITSITDGTPSNSTGVTPTAKNLLTPSNTTTSATFSVQFDTPGDTMEYDVVVSNLGSLDAKLNNVVLSAEDGEGVTTTVQEVKGINYEVTIDGKQTSEALNSVIEGKNGDTVSTSTVHVKVYWDKDATEIPAVTTKKLTVALEYVQDTK